MKFFLLLGRLLYSALFIGASFGHFSKHTIEYGASFGVPMASFLVPLSGILALLGGLSILIGYKARLGALLLIIFLIPVTFTMHKFWGIADPMAATVQQVMFMKNMALLGTAFMIAYFGSGPLSVDPQKRW
jgi:putative oxidoreductase